MLYRFKLLYQAAFDELGYVKHCDKSIYRELISISNIIEPSINHGDAPTAQMDVNSIRALYHKIK
jgi:hypothetical protein